MGEPMVTVGSILQEEHASAAVVEAVEPIVSTPLTFGTTLTEYQVEGEAHNAVKTLVQYYTDISTSSPLLISSDFSTISYSLDSSLTTLFSLKNLFSTFSSSLDSSLIMTKPDFDEVHTDWDPLPHPEIKKQIGL